MFCDVKMLFSKKFRVILFQSPIKRGMFCDYTTAGDENCQPVEFQSPIKRKRQGYA